jgi:extradiol dioxygenase family protein
LRLRPVWRGPPALGFTVRYHGERAIFFADPSGNRLEVYYRPEI